MGVVCVPGCGQFSVRHKLNFAILLGLISLTCSACQVQTISATQLQIHQARIDRDGLTALQEDPDLHITCAPPAGWDRLPLKSNPLYLHQQWRSINRQAGFGVAFIRTPVPLSPEMVLWFAKSQCAANDKSQGHGKLTSEWTDPLGRHWFEAENDLYHVRGYAMTRGLSAWLVYSGYRVKSKPADDLIALAAKAAESVAPMTPAD